MELSKILNDALLGESSIKAISKSSGAKKAEVQQVLSSALPALIKGMHSNASSKGGEQALLKALSDHAETDSGDITSFLKNVDTEDGQKIISHILGSGKKSVEDKIADKTGLKSGQISGIIATAAPLLLNLIGKKKKDDDGGSGGILDILGSVLGGGSKDDGLGDVLADGLGSLLGGKDDKKKKDEGLGGLLGSLLGGGGKEKPSSSNKKKPTAKKPAAKKPAAKKPAAKKKK